MIRYLLTLLMLVILISCQKEEITLGTGVSETFFLKSKGASMPVMVEGNTASKTFLLLVHGGPGSDSQAHNTEYISNNIEDKYACAYWDQRNSGASQGGANEEHLTVEQMTEDLKQVIQVLKYRYGNDISVFLLGHSYGGLLMSSFMTTDNYQQMVKGWIFMDGAHDYKLNYDLTGEMLLKYGEQEIEKNKNKDEWKNIVSFCNENPEPETYEQATQMNKYAHSAETYIDEVTDYGSKQILNYYTQNNFPFTSAFFNVYKTSRSDFCKGLEEYEYSSSLHKVMMPTLLLFGKYDFICPPSMGQDVYNKISSTDKKIVLSLKSGHYFDYQDPELFCYEVNKFIEKFK